MLWVVLLRYNTFKLLSTTQAMYIYVYLILPFDMICNFMFLSSRSIEGYSGSSWSDC